MQQGKLKALLGSFGDHDKKSSESREYETSTEDCSDSGQAESCDDNAMSSSMCANETTPNNDFIYMDTLLATPISVELKNNTTTSIYTDFKLEEAQISDLDFDSKGILVKRNKNNKSKDKGCALF